MKEMTVLFVKPRIDPGSTRSVGAADTPLLVTENLGIVTQQLRLHRSLKRGAQAHTAVRIGRIL